MANFPTSVSTDANLYVAVNGVQTTLAANILATDTTIQLTSTTGFPSTGFVTIDNAEVVSYTGISGPNLTGCTRGADGTTALPHNTGVTVGATIVAAHHNLLKNEVIAIETALGAGMSNVFPATPTTGLGNVVLANSPTLVTPALGTPSAIVLTNATGLPNSATTATAGATPNTIVLRDANANTKVNTIVENFSTTVTAAGTTALTAATSPLQQFTGTSTQTVTLPDATTLTVGFQITVLNRSTGAVTVNNFGGLLQQTVPTTAQTTFTCTNVGSSNGTWDVSTSSAAGITAYREDYVVGTALNNYTGSATVFNLVTPYSVGGHSMVVTLDGDVQTIGATVDYQETNSTTITFNNALVTGQKVSFIFQTATSSGGTVNSGSSGQVAYYPATGPTISGTSDPTQVPAIALATLNVQNLLDNGGFEIWQRGTSFSNPTNGAYTTDRWFVNHDGTPTFTISKETSLTDFKSAAVKVDLTVVGGATNLQLRQLIENFADYAGKTVTLSARVKSSVSGVQIRVDDGITSFISNSHSGSGNYETLAVTGLMSTSISRLLVTIGNSSSSPVVSTIYFTSVMLAIGSITPVFVPTNSEVDLARCQRYCQLGNLDHWSPIWRQDASNQGTNTTVPFRVSMRIAPTVTFTNKFVLLRHLPTTGSGSSVDSTNWTISAASISTSEFLDAWARTSDQTTWELGDFSANWTASADL